jgi:ribosomal protein S27AE
MAYQEPYHDVAATVRKQANHKCERCGISSIDAVNEYGSGLETHHIKPVRTFKNESDAHTVDNLTLLCPRCHVNAEFGAFKQQVRRVDRVQAEVIRAVKESDEPMTINQLVQRLERPEAVVREASAHVIQSGSLNLTPDGLLSTGYPVKHEHSAENRIGSGGMTVKVSDKDVHTDSTDARGRLTLGSEYANRDAITVAVVDEEDTDD